MVSEFLECLDQFSRSLLYAKDSSTNNQLTLTQTGLVVQLDSMRTAADYVTASK